MTYRWRPSSSKGVVVPPSRSILVALSFAAFLAPLFPHSSASAEDERPSACDAIGDALGESDGSPEARARLDHALTVFEQCPDIGGALAVRLANRLRDEGDSMAPRLYERAIRLGPNDPEHEIAYADYLRVYRGPLQPLFPEAEAHYHAALRKLHAGWPRHDRLLEEVQRRLAALYEQDGVPLLAWGMVPGLSDDEDRPLVFFSTQNRYARALDGFDEVDDVRDLTFAEKLLVSRSGSDLSDAERRELVHPRMQWESFNRLRLRYRWLPVLDLFYDRVHSDDSQLTTFDSLGDRNDYDLGQLGVGLERSFDLYPVLDLGIRVEYLHGKQEGLIEFAPDADEDLDAVRLLVKGSRFWGRDKINLELRYFYEDLDQDVAEPIDRHLDIVGLTLRYQHFTVATFNRKFDLRNNELFAGFAHGTEEFGSVDVHRNDVYFGVALRGLGFPREGADRRLATTGPLDIELQPTFLLGDQEGTNERGEPVSRFSNAQYRTSLTALYRLIDNENQTVLQEMDSLGPVHLAFLDVVVPLAHDLAIEGPNEFESVRLGVNLAAKAIVAASAQRSSYLGATILAEAGYRFQEYYRIDEGDHLFNLSLKVGF